MCGCNRRRDSLNFGGRTIPRGALEFPDGHCEIGEGRHLWFVIEKENLARCWEENLEPAVSPRPVGDLLGVLELLAFRGGFLMGIQSSSFVKEGRIFSFIAWKCAIRWEMSGLNPASRRIQSDFFPCDRGVEKAGEKEILGELTVLAYDEPIDANKFVVADTLTEDGRIGKVIDVQGIVTHQAGAARALDAGARAPGAPAWRLGAHRCARGQCDRVCASSSRPASSLGRRRSSN